MKQRAVSIAIAALVVAAGLSVGLGTVQAASPCGNEDFDIADSKSLASIRDLKPGESEIGREDVSASTGDETLHVELVDAGSDGELTWTVYDEPDNCDQYTAGGCDQNNVLDTETDGVTYNVTAAARHGKVGLVGWWEVERLPPEDSGKRDLSAQYRHSDLQRGIMFGQLNETGDEDAFVAEYQSCDADEDPYVRFDVRGMDGDGAHLLDLAVRDEGGQWYNDTNTTDPTVMDEWPGGDTYTYEVFLASADEGRIGYEIRYQTECHGDGGDSGPDDGGNTLIPQ